MSTRWPILLTLLLLCCDGLNAVPLEKENDSDCKVVDMLSRSGGKDVFRGDDLYLTAHVMNPPWTVYFYLDKYLEELPKKLNRSVELSYCNGAPEIYTRVGGRLVQIPRKDKFKFNFEFMSTSVVLKMKSQTREGSIERMFETTRLLMPAMQAFSSVLAREPTTTTTSTTTTTTTLAPEPTPLNTNHFIAIVVILMIIVALLCAVLYRVYRQSKTSQVPPARQPEAPEALPMMDKVSKKMDDDDAPGCSTQQYSRDYKLKELDEDLPCTSNDTAEAGCSKVLETVD